ncbi:GNAT family N-acetyltransferase [Nocardiopsis changdeensis]|uniref:GNAT family N-acetyltransferase n=1 Tax=Nocardiopsis changdeensis TaxID=2831969 RepID=A0ABX8BYV8_9ACTN|nr:MULTISPECIES: GNAT family N-acetyltransferase [Nocardiopsis]QUX25523.1 GNAT family N-acetyltransferase [Nocardiopsis changdeensis]QYX35909.1 GNAT family N-acetyltransferase [Nocardiopsis sp. MT53]
MLTRDRALRPTPALDPPPTVRDLCPGYRIARWDSPASLSADRRERLHMILRGLAARAFGADHSAYWHARIEGGFFDRVTSLALILDHGGVPVGWGGYHRLRLDGRPALYLDATGVVPAHRRTGLTSALMTHFLTREIRTRPLRGMDVVMRTRHPAVYAGWLHGLGPHRVFPNTRRALPARVRRVAAEAADWLGDGPGLDPDTLVVRDAYRVFEGDVYGVRPRSGHSDIDDLFARTVGPKDALMVVAHLDAAALARCALARAARSRVRRMPALGGRPRRGGAAPVHPDTADLLTAARP